jgi:hypothetical protein
MKKPEVENLVSDSLSLGIESGHISVTFYSYALPTSESLEEDQKKGHLSFRVVHG